MAEEVYLFALDESESIEVEPVLCAGWPYLLGGILTGDGYGLQDPPDLVLEQPLLDFLRGHFVDAHPSGPTATTVARTHGAIKDPLPSHSEYKSPAKI